MPATLGNRIRERRLALGYSLGQLATKLGITAAVVRAWERNHELPPDDALVDLGAVLDLDVAELRSLAAVTEVAPPATPPVAPAPAPPTPEPKDAEPEAAPPPPEPKKQEPAGIPDATAPAVVNEAEPESPEPPVAPAKSAVPAEASVETPASEPASKPAAAATSASRTAATDERSTVVPSGEVFVAFEQSSPAPAVPAASPAAVPPKAPRVPVQQPTPSASQPAAPSAALADAPTEAVPAVTTRPRATTETRRDPIEPPPAPTFTNPLAALFDPDKRWIYWLRAALTAIVLLVFLVVLAWAGRQLLDALGQLLDSFGDATETTTTLP